MFVKCDKLKYSNRPLVRARGTWLHTRYRATLSAQQGITAAGNTKIMHGLGTHCLLYLCHSARRLSNADCFSVAFAINSPCCFWSLATSSSSWLPSPSLFMAEHKAISLVFSCSTAWQTSWRKGKGICHQLCRGC